MWIIRFQKLKTKDYNYINRKLANLGFFTRKLSGVLLIKASIYHIIEKKSWRCISTKLCVNHIQLFKFYSNYKDTKEFIEIFHYLIDNKVMAFIPDNRSFILSEIDNNNEYIKLTKNELGIIFSKLN
ncbi:hypothetical protein EOM39_03225 [Candidatus Gracilibacteria bacterium]|nr:hypothetical protein [Candidatus Gracilibacteria bacterium]